MTLSEWYKAGNHLPNMAKGGKAKKSTRRVSDDPIGDFLNDYEMEKLTKGIAELDAKIKDLEPVPTQVETGSDPMLLDVYPRLKREMEADPHLYEYGTTDKKDPSFRRPMLRKPAGRPDDVIPDRLDNDWLEYQLRPRGQTDFSDKLPPGMELPIGKVRSLLEDPSEYYAKGGVSLKNIESQEGLAPYGLRHSGEGAKGKGYFGGMSGKHGMVTELSAESEGIGEHPLIVPTLTREELEHLLAGGDPTESIYNKARQHAEGRKSKGKEAFAGPSELRYPMPEYAKGGEVSGPKGFGLADVAPFVSPVSMKTGGQARTRAGTIAKPTFIDEQLRRTSERLSKLATDPQQAMRDIAAQYFPSPTDSPEEQQRKLEELTLGFTGNIKPVGGATNKIFYRGSTADEKVLRPSSGHEHGVSGISTSPNKEFAGKHGNYIKSYSAKPGEFVDFFDLVKMYDKSFGEDAFLNATDKSVAEFAKSKGYIGSYFDDPFGGEDYRFFDASSLKPVKPDINKAKGGLAHMANGGQGRTRAGTIAKPTFIDEQIDRTRERLSKLYNDPDQALRDIAQQYFPSAADTPEEQQQKLEDLALGFTGNIKPVGGLKQMGGLQFDPRFDPRAKEQERLRSLVTKVAPTGPKKVPEVSLVDYEGRPFITSMSDRIAGGGQLQAINDVNLIHPVDLLGGQDYMFNNKGKVWSSAASPVTQIMRNASLMKQETGQNPIFLPWRMAPTGGDFAHMTGETMLSYANSAMDKTGKKLIDKEMKTFIPSWKGISSPESISQFRNASDKTRKAIKNMLDVNFRDSGGLGIGEARLSVADPKQLLAPDTGIMNVGEIFAGNPVISESGHFSYPKAIPGRGLGRLKEKRSIYELLPAAAKARGIQDPTMPSQTDIRALQMKPYAGIIDDKLLKLLGY